MEALPLQYHLEHHHSAAGARLDCAQVLHRIVVEGTRLGVVKEIQQGLRMSKQR